MDVPEIGDEIAAARALNDLGRSLLETAAGDVDQLTPIASAAAATG
jgi:hypothetical protein